MKKIISIIISIAMLVCVFPLNRAGADTVKTPGDFGWYTDDNNNFAGWSAVSAENIASSRSTSVNRTWKPLLSNQYNFKFHVDVQGDYNPADRDNDASFPQIVILGNVIELDSRHGNGNEVYVKLNNVNMKNNDGGDWLYCNNRVVSIDITRSYTKNISVVLTGTGQTVSFTMTGLQNNENIEFRTGGHQINFNNISVSSAVKEDPAQTYFIYDGWNSFTEDNRLAFASQSGKDGTLLFTKGIEVKNSFEFGFDMSALDYQDNASGIAFDIMGTKRIFSRLILDGDGHLYLFGQLWNDKREDWDDLYGSRDWSANTFNDGIVRFDILYKNSTLTVKIKDSDDTVVDTLTVERGLEDMFNGAPLSVSFYSEKRGTVKLGQFNGLTYIVPPVLKSEAFPYRGIAYSPSELFNEYNSDLYYCNTSDMVDPGTYKLQLATKDEHTFPGGGTNYEYTVTISENSSQTFEGELAHVSLGARVGENISLDLYVTPKDLSADYISAAFIGQIGTKQLSLQGRKTNDGFIIEIPEVYPHQMADVLSGTVSLTCRDSEASPAVKLDNNISIMKYCEQAAAAYHDNAALLNFLANMLEYGAACQKYKNYNTDNLANKPSFIALSKTDETPVSRIADDEISTLIKKTGSRITAASLLINEKINIVFDVRTTTPQNIKMTVTALGQSKREFLFTGKDDKYVEKKSAGSYSVNLLKINPTMYDTVYTACLYENDELIQTVRYSVNTYLARKNAAEGLKALVRSIYNYGLAAAICSGPTDVFLNSISNLDSYYTQLAACAVNDVLNNFWDFKDNHVIPTINGFPVNGNFDYRGSVWETAQLIYGIYDMWVITGEDYYKNLLAGQAAFMKESFDYATLTTAGGFENWATDDCYWNCMEYLILYKATGDKWFLDVTEGLLNSAQERWGDSAIGGGLWYNDERNRKSAYQVGESISWFTLWKETGKQTYYDKAMESYTWMEQALGQRTDGLYYCEVDVNGPLGTENNIYEAGSSSFLTANMGMAALSVMFYQETGEQKYLDRAYKVCDGITAKYNDGGVLLDDRDAWTNGAFASYFASYVLSLPDTDEIKTLCRNTAISIFKYDRTPDGYYGGTWKGPAEGNLSRWYRGGSVASQSATTGTAVSMITSMAVLETGIIDYMR